MKYTNYIGITTVLLLVWCCFLPWAYYPDLQEMFTGFYSKNNQYGRPGKALIILAAASGVFFLIPRLWSKRFNQFLSVLIFAYAIKNYVIFSACYAGNCPLVKPGLIGILIFSLGIVICSLLSRVNNLKT